MMTPQGANGAELLCNSLESLGVEHVFGVPGTQSVLLYDALQRSKIRSVLSTHELGASFMANGYYRASGKIAPLLTIPGPGFTYALTGLAEARHDSAALLHIVGLPAGKSGKKFVFQAIDQGVVAGPLVKGVYSITHVDQIPKMAREAFGLAFSGEPGPVLLQWSREALSASPAIPVENFHPGIIEELVPDDILLDEAAKLLGAARRPLLMAGQGAASGAALVKRFAESIASPVFTTSSGRGVLPEDHALALGFDLNRGAVRDLNELIGKSDCVLALGCKFTHPGTGNFALELPPEHFIHVDASREVLGANYPARLAIHGSVEVVLGRLLRTVRRSSGSMEEGWKPDEIEGWKKRFHGMPSGTVVLEPIVHGVSPATAGSFFAALRRALPRDGIVVTDSGLHQGLVRRHFDVLSPRGLILPSDLQSMGFGLPAAIGAKLAAPERPVVAVIGDGGFAMSGMELLTAVREKIPLTVIVFNDGRLNLIRLQQLSNFGRSESVDLLNPDFGAFAAAVGAQYALIDGNAEEVLEHAVNSSDVTLVEVLVGDSPAIHLMRAKGFTRETARRVLGPGMVRRAKSWLRRQSPG